MQEYKHEVEALREQLSIYTTDVAHAQVAIKAWDQRIEALEKETHDVRDAVDLTKNQGLSSHPANQRTLDLEIARARARALVPDRVLSTFTLV